jgi:tetratricopeptide (TPR) repeat protein
MRSRSMRRRRGSRVGRGDVRIQRRHYRSACVAALISLLVGGVGVDVRAGSLDDFNNAKVVGWSRENHLPTIALYSTALAADLIDNELSAQQRIEAVISRGERLFLLKRYDEALSDFSSLIEGTDPRVGALPGTSEAYGLSLFWRAQCYADMDQTEKAVLDIDRAYELLRENAVVERMRNQIKNRLKPNPT